MRFCSVVPGTGSSYMEAIAEEHEAVVRCKTICRCLYIRQVRPCRQKDGGGGDLRHSLTDISIEEILGIPNSEILSHSTNELDSMIVFCNDK